MSIRCFTPYDWSRSYVLPDYVTTNIPRSGRLAGLGAHNYARALLVEISRYTRSAPRSLHYREVDIARDDMLLVITAVAGRDDGTTFVVTTRTRQRPLDSVHGDWSIEINGLRRPDEDRRYPPSPPVQGFIVARLA